MDIRTVGRYLIGDRQAILDIARGRHVLWLGAIFVLSAGVAHKYDGEDLLHEPWHLALPFVASVGRRSSSSWWRAALLEARGSTKFFHCYLSFLGLFWMTAPAGLVVRRDPL